MPLYLFLFLSKALILYNIDTEILQLFINTMDQWNFCLWLPANLHHKTAVKLQDQPPGKYASLAITFINKIYIEKHRVVGHSGRKWKAHNKVWDLSNSNLNHGRNFLRDNKWHQTQGKLSRSTHPGDLYFKNWKQLFNKEPLSCFNATLAAIIMDIRNTATTTHCQIASLTGSKMKDWNKAARKNNRAECWLTERLGS